MLTTMLILGELNHSNQKKREIEALLNHSETKAKLRNLSNSKQRDSTRKKEIMSSEILD